METNWSLQCSYMQAPGTGIWGHRDLQLRFESIVCNSLKVWNAVEIYLGNPFKCHTSTLNWNNYHLQSLKKPFLNVSWSSQGIYTLKDIFGDCGLLSLQEITSKFDIPVSSHFLYLQLKLSLRTYGVPWQSSMTDHPLFGFLHPFASSPVGFQDYIIIYLG